MNPSSATKRKNRLILAFICGILFFSFSFVYLYRFQGELMRFVYDTCSSGKVAYSPFWGALILTLVLCVLRWLLNKLTRFRGLWLAFSYLPAYCILSFITCVNPDGEGIFSIGFADIWIAVVAYAAIGWGYRKYLFGKSDGTGSLADMLIPNLIVLIMGSYGTGLVGNGNILLHHELAIAQKIREGEFEKALDVGQKSLHNSHTLTALHAFALAHTEGLGESLFEYPQSNGADGLFFGEDGGGASMFTDKDIESLLGGASRNPGESSLSYLQRICRDSVDNRRALDYYLCALLLEKQLDEFYQVLSACWPADTPLPRHYQEAVLMYLQQTDAESPFRRLCTPSVEERHDAFLQLQAQYSVPLHQNNYTRRKFGDTYWWYYCYGEKGMHGNEGVD